MCGSAVAHFKEEKEQKSSAFSCCVEYVVDIGLVCQYMFFLNIPAKSCLCDFLFSFFPFPNSVKPCIYMESCYWSLTRRLKEKSEKECWFPTTDTGRVYRCTGALKAEMCDLQYVQ